MKKSNIQANVQREVVSSLMALDFFFGSALGFAVSDVCSTVGSTESMSINLSDCCDFDGPRLDDPTTGDSSELPVSVTGSTLDFTEDFLFVFVSLRGFRAVDMIWKEE